MEKAESDPSLHLKDCEEIRGLREQDQISWNEPVAYYRVARINIILLFHKLSTKFKSGCFFCIPFSCGIRWPFWGYTQCVSHVNSWICERSWFPTSLVHPTPLSSCQQLCILFRLCPGIAMINGHIRIWHLFTIICEDQNTFASLVSGKLISQRGFEFERAKPQLIIR